MTDSVNDAKVGDSTATEGETDGAPKEEKLQSIMEAANALTALGDEEDAAEGATASSTVLKEEPDATREPPKDDAAPSSKPPQQKAAVSNNSKRFLPEHKKPDAAPTFPEKMMAMMRYVDQYKDDENYCAAWLPDGKSFVVRNPDDFTRQVVPQFFKATKFSSFTRKLYRWGFRQINRGIGPDDPVIFGNEFFDRDNEALMSKMRSVTAAGTRKSDARPLLNPYGKRPLDIGGGNNMYDMNDPQKRFLYEQFLQQQQQQQKSMQLMNQNPSLYAAMNTNAGPMNNYPPSHMIINNKPYENLMPASNASAQHHMHMPYNAMPPQQQQHMHPAMPPQSPQDMGMSHHMTGGPSPGGGVGLHNVSAHSQAGSYTMGHGGGGGGNNQHTAEIVNAAIRALQYSS